MSKWIESLRKNLKEIESLNPQDKLDYLIAIQRVHNGIVGSCNGWAIWIKNLNIMSKFTKRELEEIFRDLYDVLTIYAEIDIKWTKRLEDKYKNKTPKRQIKKQYNYVR